MEQPENNHEPSRWAGLKTRIISGAVMAAVALVALWQGGWLFTFLILVVAMLMIHEWNNLTGRDKPSWRIAGLLYVAAPCASMIWLRNAESGAQLVLYLLLAVWATDIGAYFTGRRIGGPKLAPSVSPGKTWAGLAGGVVSAAVVGGLSSFFTPYPPSVIAGIDLAAMLALIAQLSDLFESWLKRRAGAKDSGSLIPGHGGLLDRVDGLVFSVPVFALMVYLYGR